MIVPKLIGRLGNQCFQSAHAISYALQHGHEYHIPTMSENENFWPATFKHLANPNYSRFANQIQLKEAGHHYNPMPYDAAWQDNNIVIEGYFQSEKYFEGHIDEVRQALKIDYIRQAGFVGIHVRRGDYLRYADAYPPVNYSYIRDAVAYFNDFNYKSFAVFSDDINWCKVNVEKIKKEIPLVEFTYVEGNRPLVDMALLSSCDHHVISNSSFSLFAHILCQNPNKFCIAPDKWYGPKNSHLSVADIYPKNCIKL